MNIARSPCVRATRSSSAPCPFPATSKLFNRTVDNLFRQGVDVLYHELGDVHVRRSRRADYRHMLELVRPKYFIPVHGEYRHLVLHPLAGS